MWITHPHSGKRALCLLLCLLVFLSSLTEADAAQPANNKTVNAGVFYFDGYHMEGEDGGLTGYGVEFLNLVSQYSHLNFSYVGYDKSWEDMLAMLDSGEIDVVTSARKTPKREETYAFSLPIGRNSTVLSIQTGNTSQISGNYTTYNGITIGVLPGSSQNQSLAEFARENGFSYQAREYGDVSQMEEDLQNGTIDAILSSSLRRTEDEKTLDIIETDYFYAIVRKDDAELLAELNYAIDQMNIHEGDWSNILTYKYYGNSTPATLSFTQREQAYIQDVVSGKKQITVTSMGDRKPYSYVEDGELKGILPDYFAEVMVLAGLPYKIVVPADRAEYYDLANHNGVDVVIDWRQSQSKTDSPVSGGFCTDAYMSTGMAQVTRKDFSGEVSTLAVADIQDDIAIEQDLIGEAQVLNCSTREEALQAVLDGRADAAYVYTYTAQSFVNNDPTDSLHFSIVNSLRFDFKMYVRDSCDHELITILNKCIRHMPNDSMSHLITTYTASTPFNVSFIHYLRSHPGIVIMTALLVAAAIGVIISLYLRSWWNKKLLRTTELTNQTLEQQLAVVNTLSRDYLNVYAVNARADTARVVKLTGYVAPGLDPNSKKEVSYSAFMLDYINNRVFDQDRQYLTEALALDTIIEKLGASTEYAGGYRVLIDGEIHTYQFICATYLEVDGSFRDPGGFFLIGFRNIDEIIRREREQKAVLETALAEAQRANKAKTTFLNNMSHDIRTPMNAIIGFASLALSHSGNQGQVEGYLDKILTSGKHLLSLINDVLDMSRIESGKVKIEESEASLPEIMQDLRTIVQADVKTKQLSFHMDTQGIINETIICDKLRLNQVLLNILSNAMKYTRPGGTVSVRVTQIGGALEGRASYQFRIKDTGIGMSKEFQKHLFEPFERERTATVSGIQGTGLGLAITKNIVDMMNGTITVTSEEGKGSEFVVSFRFRVKEDPAGRPYVEKRASASEDDAKKLLVGKKILLVEDNELNQEIACTVLEEAGLVVDTAGDGPEAVEAIQTAQAGTYDLILMDIQIPVMDGYTAARTIRAMDDPAKAGIPIVAMTANAFEEDRQRAFAAGMDGHVPKPIDIPKLMETLALILSGEG